MIDYAVLIKQAVTVPQILAMYGYDTPRGRRIPCPIHHGDNRNFAFWDDRYKCFVCGAHGDVISLVMALFDLPFQDALKRIDTDFRLGLNVGGKHSDTEDERLRRVCDERIAARRAHNAERDRLNKAYDSAMDEYCRLDRIIMDTAPQTPFDDISDEYVDALRKRDLAGYAVDEAQRALWEFEHERTDSV